MWDKTFNLLVLIIVLKVMAAVITRFINSCRISSMENRLKLGLVSRGDLINISDSSFIYWCYNIMKKLNFSNIDIISASLKDNVQIYGYKDKKKTYLKCIKCEYISNPKDKDALQDVSISDVQKLIGTMEHDGIKNAWIITNGNFSKDTLNYVETIPASYNITLIDGCDLTKLHRSYQKQYITSSLI